MNIQRDTIGYKYFLDEFKEWEARKYPILFVLGSGASVSSGIPTGGTLARKWLSKIHQRDYAETQTFAEFIELISNTSGPLRGITEGNIPAFYPGIYKELFKIHPQRGYDEIQSLIEGGRPSLGYTLLAHLLNRRQVTDVLTTNFDNLVERAVARFTNSFPRVVGHELLVESVDSLTSVPTIIKIHRDAYFGPASLETEIKGLKDRWSPILKKALPRYIPVIIGYGGNDAGLVDVLGEMNQTNFPRGIYWLTFDEDAPNQRLRDIVVNLGGSFVPTKGFDRTLLDIALTLGLDERVISNSISEHFLEIQQDLQDQMVHLAAAHTSSSGLDIVDTAAVDSVVEHDEELLADLSRFSDSPRVALAGAKTFTEAREHFSRIERPVLTDYNNLLKRANSFSQAQRVFEDMRASGMAPDPSTYCKLIKKATNYERAREVFERMKQDGVVPEIMTYSSLVNRADDFEGARAVFDEMINAGIPRSNFAYCSLINKSRGLSEAKEVFEEMERNGIEGDVYSYTSLINKTNDHKQARAIVEQMISSGVEPNAYTYSALLRKEPDFSSARKLITQLNRAGLPSAVMYRTLIDKAKNITTARKVLAEMFSRDLPVDVYAYNHLLEKTKGYTSARKVVDEMKSNGIEPNVFTYGVLITRARVFEVARPILEEMQKADIAPDAFIFTRLLVTSINADQAKEVFARMRIAGVLPTVIMYNVLINRAKGYTQAHGVYQELRCAQLSPTITTFSKLIKKARTSAQIDEVLRELKHQGLRPDVFVYNTLLSKTGNIEAALRSMEQMITAGVRPDETTWSILLRRASGYNRGRRVFDEMLRQGVQGPPEAYLKLLKRVRGLSNFLDFFELIGLVPLPSGALKSKLEEVIGAHAETDLLVRLADANIHRLREVLPLFSAGNIIYLLEKRIHEMLKAGIPLSTLFVPGIRRDKERILKARFEVLFRDLIPSPDRDKIFAYQMLHYGQYAKAYKAFQNLVVAEQAPFVKANYETRSAECLLLAGRTEEALRHALKARSMARNDQSDQLDLIVACTILSAPKEPIESLVSKLRTSYFIDVGRNRLKAARELIKGRFDARADDLKQYLDNRYRKTPRIGGSD